jgi:hypothetical protein
VTPQGQHVEYSVLRNNDNNNNNRNSLVNITNEIFVQSNSIPFSYPLLDRPVLTDAMYLLYNPHDTTTEHLFYRLLSTAVTGWHANALAETVCTWCRRYRNSVLQASDWDVTLPQKRCPTFRDDVVVSTSQIEFNRNVHLKGPQLPRRTHFGHFSPSI